MCADSGDWLELGDGSQDELQVIAEKIRRAWAGRYEMEIVAPDGVISVRHVLRVRHYTVSLTDMHHLVP